MVDDKPIEERERHRLRSVALALFMQALAVGVLLGARALDPYGRVIGRTSSLGAGAPLDDVGAFLHDPAVMAHVGQQVALRDVRVDAIVGDSVFWIGEGGDRIPVVLTGERWGRQPEEAVEVDEGDEVTLFGVLRRTEGSVQLMGSHLLDAGERKRLEQSLVYIAADNVVVAQHGRERPVARRAQSF